MEAAPIRPRSLSHSKANYLMKKGQFGFGGGEEERGHEINHDRDLRVTGRVCK